MHQDGREALVELFKACEARQSVVSNGPAAGCRQIELRTSGGIDLRISPDRGFDIAQAWWRGESVAWAAPSREGPPVPNLRGLDWIRSFSGGLVTTCGLRHVGAPTDDHGLHGQFSHQRADVRAVGPTFENGVPVVSASAVVSEPHSFGPVLELHRTVATQVGAACVDVRDAVVNQGIDAERLKLLYHLNFTYHADARPSLIVDGEPVTREEFDKARDTAELDVSGRSEVALEMRNSEIDGVVRISWATSILRKLYLWTYPTTSRGGILAIEPCSESLLEEPGETVKPIELEPGQRVDTGISFTIESETDCVH